MLAVILRRPWPRSLNSAMTKATTKTMWFWWNWKMKVRYTDVSWRTYFTDIPHFQVCDELVIQASLLTTESPKGLAYSAQDDQGEVKLSLWILLSASPQVYRPVRPKNFELCWHWKWIVLNLSELPDMEIWKTELNASQYDKILFTNQVHGRLTEKFM